jgi:hypothetical protein
MDRDHDLGHAAERGWSAASPAAMSRFSVEAHKVAEDRAGDEALVSGS